MEKPMCRLCKARHWSSEPHQYPADRVVPLDKLGMMTGRQLMDVELMKLERAPKPVPKPIAPLEIPADALIDWSQCPHCAARRAKRAEVVRRNRAKKTASK